MLSNIFSAILAALVMLMSADCAFAKAASGQAPKQPANAGQYACPMHPEVVSAKSGSCLKCNMALRPVKDGGSSQAAGRPGQSGHAARVSDEIDEAPTTSLRVLDSQVLDQDGKKLNFYTDLVKGKTVAINFIFTTCTTICPPLAATFARVQRDLGERVGRDVHFISISVDPATDTPERLKAWGEKFHRGRGWTFVTGTKPDIDEILRALAASAVDKNAHPPTIIVINDRGNVVKRTYGLAKPSQLIKVITDAITGMGGAASDASTKP